MTAAFGVDGTSEHCPAQAQANQAQKYIKFLNM
jgi:hypothetical protein